MNHGTLLVDVLPRGQGEKTVTQNQWKKDSGKIENSQISDSVEKIIIKRENGRNPRESLYVQWETYFTIMSRKIGLISYGQI